MTQLEKDTPRPLSWRLNYAFSSAPPHPLNSQRNTMSHQSASCSFGLKPDADNQETMLMAELILRRDLRRFKGDNAPSCVIAEAEVKLSGFMRAREMLQDLEGEFGALCCEFDDLEAECAKLRAELAAPLPIPAAPPTVH